MEQTVYIFDTSKFSSTLTKAIENNNVIFRDGVAYWKKGLEHKGIIQHIPLKEVSKSSTESFVNVLSSVQSGIESTIAIAQVASTATLLIATAIQTQILSKKIEEVQRTVLNVSQSINEQNLIFYTDKASEYLSTIQNLRLLLKQNDGIKEVSDLAKNLLANALQTKNHLVFFINNLLGLVESGKVTDNNHIELVLNFIQQIMEVLPIGMHMEFLIAHRLGQYDFSQTLIEDSHDKYSSLTSSYKNYLNKLNNQVRLSQVKADQVPFLEMVRKPAKALFSSEIQKELLDKPSIEKIEFN